MVTLEINGVNQNTLVNFDSLEVKDNLYSNADECYFSYEKFGSRTYIPVGGDTIEVWDGLIKIFGGQITNVKARISGKSLIYDIECKDWVDQLDGELVTESYENKTVNEIVIDLQAKYATTFDISNVSCATNIEAIYFDMKPMSKCLDDLAEIVGYHWFVNASKEIYLFAEGSILSPFNVTDENGHCITQSLTIEEDYEQIKNRVNILGGKISNTQVFDTVSIASYGEHEVVIKDDSLTSTAEAEQKANSVLAAFKDPIKKGSFETYDAGLVAGQKINITSALRGVSEDFIIRTVAFVSLTPTDFIYKVSVMTQQEKGIIDMFEHNIMLPLPSTQPNLGNSEFTCDIEFSIVNYHEISWSAGTIIMSNGDSYSVASGSHSFSASEICFFAPNTSATVLQFSTSFGDGVGEDIIGLGYCIPNSNVALGAQFIPKGFMGGVQFWGGENIVARTIIADQIGLQALTSDLVTTGEFITTSAQIKNAIITNAHIINLKANQIIAGTGIINNLTIKSVLTLGDGSNAGKIETYNYSGSSAGIQMLGGSSPALNMKGANINMIGGSIAWSAVTAPDYVEIGGTKPPTDADKTSTHTSADTDKVQGVEILSLGKVKATVLTADNIITGTLDADVVTVTHINATNITGGTLNIGGTNEPTAIIIAASSITGNSRLGFENSSRIWEDSGADLGINAIGGQILLYCDSHQVATFTEGNIYFRNGASAMVTLIDGSQSIFYDGISCRGSFNVTAGYNARFANNVYFGATATSEYIWGGSSHLDLAAKSYIYGNIDGTQKTKVSSQGFSVSNGLLYIPILTGAQAATYSSQDGAMYYKSDTDELRMYGNGSWQTVFSF